jgi:hypothetical protein
MSTPTATLTDRYVWAAARDVPESQREEFARELRERIGDEIEAQLASGDAASSEDAERATIAELGDPSALAAKYVDRSLVLVGPRYYLTWKRLLVMLYSVVLPIAVAATALGLVIAETPVGELFRTLWVVALGLVVHLGFWTTLVFAILERAPSSEPGLEWTPDRLPAVPDADRRSRLGDFIASLVFLALFAVLILWQQVSPPFFDRPGEAIPVLDPDLWSFWLPYFLVLIALEMLFAVAIYLQGWTWPLAIANLVLNVAFTVPALWLLASGQLFNPAFLDAIGWPWGEAGAVTSTVLVFVLVGVAVWDVVDGVIKTVRGRGGSALALGRI